MDPGTASEGSIDTRLSAPVLSHYMTCVERSLSVSGSGSCTRAEQASLYLIPTMDSPHSLEGPPCQGWRCFVRNWGNHASGVPIHSPAPLVTSGLADCYASYDMAGASAMTTQCFESYAIQCFWNIRSPPKKSGIDVGLACTDYADTVSGDDQCNQRSPPFRA